MRRIGIICGALAGIVIGQLLAPQTSGQERATLNLVTAGDQNMVDYVKDYLGPMFEKDHPGVTVRAVGTGPGDAGSQKIYEKLEAQKSNNIWDIDIAVIHQKANIAPGCHQIHLEVRVGKHGRDRDVAAFKPFFRAFEIHKILAILTRLSGLKRK